MKKWRGRGSSSRARVISDAGVACRGPGADCLAEEIRGMSGRDPQTYRKRTGRERGGESRKKKRGSTGKRPRARGRKFLFVQLGKPYKKKAKFENQKAIQVQETGEIEEK